MKELKDGISLVKKYEDLLKGVNRKIINIVRKTERVPKNIQDNEEFFDCVGLSRSNIYFKITYANFYVNFQY